MEACVTGTSKLHPEPQKINSIMMKHQIKHFDHK